MSWALLFAIAALTYVSRALGLLAVPEAKGRVRDILLRLPVPLFAALGTLALLPDGTLVGVPVLGAFVGAVLAVALRRSLLVALVGGVLGYTVGFIGS